MTKDCKNMNTWMVYVHTTPNNKKYVGITSVGINKRWGKNGGHYKGQMFYRAIKKYGWGNINHEIIAENIFYNKAKDIEIFLIEFFRTHEYDFGYNLTKGGDGHNGVKASEETKEKQRNNREGIKACGYGNFPSDKTKQKMSNSGKNKVFTNETRKKMSVEKNKPVFQYDKDGNFINTYNSASKASNILKINIGNLCACCRNVVKFAGGYHWSYELIDNPETVRKILNNEIILPIIKTRNEKPVIQLDLNDNIVNEYKSAKDASIATNIPSQEISQSCKNIRKVTRGFKWRFKL